MNQSSADKENCQYGAALMSLNIWIYEFEYMNLNKQGWKYKENTKHDLLYKLW